MARPLGSFRIRRRSSLLAGIAVAASLASVGTAVSADSIISTVVGTGSSGKAASGAGTSFKVNSPNGVAAVNDGLLIADSDNDRILKWTGSTGRVVVAADAGIDDPQGIVAASDGSSYYFANKGKDAVSLVSANTIRTVSSRVNGNQTLDEPSDISAVGNGSNNIFVADTGNDRIAKLTPDGAATTAVGLRGSSGSIVGTASQTRLRDPEALTTDVAGDLLIADTGNHRVLKAAFSSGVGDPQVTVVAGTGSSGAAVGDGKAAHIQLDEPAGLLALSNGGYVIADRGNRRLVYVEPGANPQATIVAGGNGLGDSGDGGPATAAKFKKPSALATYGNKVVVADTGSHRLRSFGLLAADPGPAPAAPTPAPAPTDPEAETPAPAITPPADPAPATPPPAGPVQGAGAAAAVSTAPLPGGERASDSSAAGALPAPAEPVVGKRVEATTASGEVSVRLPGSNRSIDLNRAASLPTGTVVDTRRGRIRLTSAAGRGGRTQTASLWSGVFKIRQTRGPKPVTDLVLQGAIPRCERSGAQASSSRRRATRRLWGRGKGRFRTRGRYGAGTVRGTTWLVEDRCDGTLVKVRSGLVLAQPNGRGRGVLLRKGQKRFIRAPRAARRR